MPFYEHFSLLKEEEETWWRSQDSIRQYGASKSDKLEDSEMELREPDTWKGIKWQMTTPPKQVTNQVWPRAESNAKKTSSSLRP
jgi:hypothetical protein